MLCVVFDVCGSTPNFVCCMFLCILSRAHSMFEFYCLITAIELDLYKCVLVSPKLGDS